MITIHLDREHSILHIQPQSALEQADFEKLAATVDPYIAETGGLAGLIVEAPSFPGWKRFGALVAHLRFVRDHHKFIRRIAVVTDSTFGDLAEDLAAHFVSAEIRHFPASEIEKARRWITDPS